MSSVRDVTIVSAGFTLAVPDGPSAAESQYLVGSEAVGGLDGRVGIVTESGVTTLAAIGRAADPLAVTGASLARERNSMAVRGGDGDVSLIRGGDDPWCSTRDPVFCRRRSTRVDSPGPSRPARRVICTRSPRTARYSPCQACPATGGSCRSTSRATALVCSQLDTASGPRLIVAGILRNADDTPVNLTSTVIDLRVGSEPLIDAAWVDGATVVALSGSETRRPSTPT